MNHTHDNVGSRDRGPTLLMALRAGRPEHTPEAEPVLVSVRGESVVLELDDGERIEVDHAELIASIGERRALREAA